MSREGARIWGKGAGRRKTAERRFLIKNACASIHVEMGEPFAVFSGSPFSLQFARAIDRRRIAKIPASVYQTSFFGKLWKNRQVSLFEMILGVAAWCLLNVAVENVIGSFASCIHGGAEYEEGEYFPPNDTVIKADGPLQCVQCRCHQGLVVCEIENCTALNCGKPAKHSKFCCQQCPGPSQSSSKFVFDRIDFGDYPLEKSKLGCFSNGRYFEEGAVWQPIIGPFGVMACVQCRCLSKSIVCDRVRCENLSCSHPERELGQCCPVCPSMEIKKKAEIFCLPNKTELIVYKTPGVHNDSDIIELGFIENKSKSTTVRVHSWNLRKKSSPATLTTKTILRKDFYKKNWQILGSTSQKRLRKYLRKEKNLRESCVVKCLEKIRRLEGFLGARPPVSRQECNEDEIEVPGY